MFEWFATSHPFIGSAMMKPTRRPIDITNQKKGDIVACRRVLHARTSRSRRLVFVEKLFGRNLGGAPSKRPNKGRQLPAETVEGPQLRVTADRAHFSASGLTKTRTRRLSSPAGELLM
jgi:hypothetical protein